MRRSDREITDFQEIIAIMNRCDVCRLGLVDSNGYPYIVPLRSLFKISSDGPNSVGFTNQQPITFKGWAK